MLAKSTNYIVCQLPKNLVCNFANDFLEFVEKSNWCLRIGQNKQALRFFAFITIIWGAYVVKVAS